VAVQELVELEMFNLVLLYLAGEQEDLVMFKLEEQEDVELLRFLHETELMG
jgi:hypothetical protein